MSIRVCMVISPLYPPRFGGGAKFPVTLSEELLKCPEIAITHLTTNPGRSSTYQTFSTGLRLCRLPALRFGGLRGETYSYALSNAFFLLKNRRAFDIIHIFGAFPYAWGALLVARMARIKSVIRMTEMCSDDPLTIRGRSLGHLQLKIFTLADRVISISHELTRVYLDAGLSPTKLMEIVNGVDQNRFRPISEDGKHRLRSLLGLPVNRTIATFVGGVIRRKGVDLLIEAWGKLKATGNSCCPILLLVGPIEVAAVRNNAEFIQWARNRVRELGIERDIRFVGRVDNVEQYLQAADMFVFPSRSEGMPSALLEALSCGLPCIASVSSGATYFIHNGEDGYIVQDEDVNALMLRVQELMETPSLKKEMGAQARRAVLRKATLEVCAKRHLELYRSLLKG
jgi:glycosyltransferase involved in cell wall biosynthesis